MKRYHSCIYDVSKKVSIMQFPYLEFRAEAIYFKRSGRPDTIK
ncbi:hypothetical protein PORCRE_296 [Porphyromonas crevioricanis JCM 15906]|uniref:Uncharacterized protein n=1 Tax=Porphyromonas crevioricanis JCM 15906 TaxID=1305617 RepID=T1CG26_9PORP|nr:hypothetical protein PORCRE_296 [Porphyromonas crevioricanis JCM 15906]GAD07234.1 hypothetical protein PORCAN_853 [Porphyromonas crevioricanis JCM 13913]